MRKHYAAVRIIEHVSGRHVWVVGRYETLAAARHARNDAIEDSADHLTKHGGKGQVLITPTDFLGIGYAVTSRSWSSRYFPRMALSVSRWLVGISAMSDCEVMAHTLSRSAVDISSTLSS